MPRNSFIRMTKLHDVNGRIDYISNPKRQENLYAVYETIDRSLWKELAKCNRQEFKKSGTDGKCIEARELIIALPEMFVDYNPDRLLQAFTNHFKQQYGTDCIAALHHNKRKTNYHIHLIFSERALLEVPIEKTATRNMFYDEQGNHVRTKKEILDADGNIRKHCKIVKKGEVYERMIFSIKDKRFKDEGFLDEVKRDYTDFINQFVRDEKQRLHVFERGGMYLATKKIGRNNPKAAEIRSDNEKRVLWNQTVDRALVAGMSKPEVLTVKKEMITDKIKESVKSSGDCPNRLSGIISAAVAVLEHIIYRLMSKVLEFTEKPSDNRQKTVTPKTDVSAILAKHDKPQEIAKPESVIPSRPKMSQEAADYPRLYEIEQKLQAQNKAIFEAERECGNMQIELSDSNTSFGRIFKASRRSELQKLIAKADKRIANMKAHLTRIVNEYSFSNVEEFYKAFYKAQSAYADCRSEQKAWDEKYKEKPLSLHDKLESYKQKVKEQDAAQPYRYSKDRGAR